MRKEASTRGKVALLFTLLVVGGMFAGVAADRTADAASGYDVTIRWTSHGIPHITAADWGSLGYGYGYAAAKDYLCLIAEEYLTVEGQRSKHFGPTGTYSLSSNGQTYTNRESDLYFTLLKENPDLVDSIADYPRAQIQDAIAGYVAGYNRWLADTPQEARPIDCRDAAWVRPITREDVVNRFNKLNLIASSGFFAPSMVRAQPPHPSLPAPAAAVDADAFANALPTSENLMLGSNGYAFGADVTANGRGMLLGNPHFPWMGPERFHELHLTIPGETDVMGMTLLGVPFVLIGFTEHAAWTHTVSTGWRFSLHELALVPGDPTAYIVDGEIERMTTRSVTVDLGNETVSRTFYFTRWGPVIDFAVASAGGQSAGLRWTPAAAYAINDANARNDRTVEQFYQWATAESFDEFVADLHEVHGIPWVNTIAASPDGRAYYADVSVVPNYDAARIAECNTPVGRALLAAARLPVFDGSRSDCGPENDPRAAQPGIIPSVEMPSITSSDWLINANDDAWLPNPDHPITGYSPMIGAGPSERSGRTRMGYLLADEHAPGTLTLPGLQASIFSERLYYPETELDNILASVCNAPVGIGSAGPADLREPCAALAAWDRRANVDSAGLPLFELFWARAPRTWGTPFDANDPVNTPRDYQGADPRARQALADAAALLRGAGLALDVKTGDARYVTRGEERIPLHGASHAVGSPSMLNIPFVAGRGFLEPTGGNSYMQTVTWGEDGKPLADAVLSYSQSPHRDSPHAADQTRLYSQKQWVTLPFTDAAINADPALVTLRLTG